MKQKYYEQRKCTFFSLVFMTFISHCYFDIHEL